MDAHRIRILSLAVLSASVITGCGAEEESGEPDGSAPVMTLDASLVDASSRDSAASSGSDAAPVEASVAPDANSENDAGVRDASAADAAAPLGKFSFFVTSLSAMRQLAKSQNGFGGNLSYGETGSGAGLRGADKICSEIAELGMPGAAAKQWRAFLSTKSPAVNAGSRIGNGPWYDRTGRLVAQNLTNLLKERPEGAAPEIIDDLPNERGEPNHAGSAEGAQDDNHDVATATNQQGNYDGGGTCSDWTSTTGSGPRVGHSWPAQSGQSWVEAHTARGCAVGVFLNPNAGPGTGMGLGGGGGYGAIYCFALTP